MLLASNRNGGSILNDPDPCLNSWRNFAFMTDALSFSYNVTNYGGNLIFLASVLAVSHGDEPDTPLYAPTIGPAFFPLGIAKVLLNGNPGITVACPSISNAGNAVQGQVSVPSPANVYMMFERPAADARQLLGRAPHLEPRRDASGSSLRIERFTSDLPAVVHALLQAGDEEPLTLDLRGNPGGDVHAAIELAGAFLERGTVIATLLDADGDATVYRARGNHPYGMPLTLLVDAHTASAAELFAGALVQSGRARLSGGPTYGKGTIDVIVETRAGGALRWRVGEGLLPDGSPIAGRGISTGASPCPR